MKAKTENLDVNSAAYRTLERTNAMADLDVAIDATLNGYATAIAAWVRYLSACQPNTWSAAAKKAQLRAIERRRPETDIETKRIQTTIKQTLAEAALLVLEPKLGEMRPQAQKRAIGRKILAGASLADAMRMEREEREDRETKKKKETSQAPAAPPATTVSKDVRYALELCDELASVVAELSDTDRVKVTTRLLNLVHGAQAPEAKGKKAA